MKKNNELDFNFDNTPYKPAAAQKRKVDRTVKKSAPTPPPVRTAEQPTYRWGNTAAPANMLTPDEIMHMGSNSESPAAKSQNREVQADLQPEKIPMAPEKREAPSVKAEPTAPDSGYSNAAMEIMRRMQKAESERTVLPKPESIEAKGEIAEAEKTVEKDINPQKAEPELKTDSVPVMPIRTVEPKAEVPMHITDERDIAASRDAKADNFELDLNAMAEGMEELNAEMTQTFDAATNGSTRMFDLVSEAPSKSEDGATRHISIPDAVDELYSDNKNQDNIIDEYNSVEDAQSITLDLITRKRRLTARVWISGILTALLFAVTLFANSALLFPFGKLPYFIAMGVLLLLQILTNLSTFSSLVSVFKLKPDIDFAPSFAMLAAVIQTVVTAFAGTGSMAHTSMLAAAAALSLTVSTLAKRMTVSRTLANFEMIANEEKKDSTAFIAPPTSERIADKSKLGETLILGRREATDLKGFIAYSLSPDFFEKQSGKFSLITVLASIIAFAAAMLTENDLSVSVSIFAATACTAAQIAVIYPNAALLSRACRRLREKRVMLSGIKAADEISEANVIVLDSDELFFDECVNLYKFRTFGDYPPDEAFMTAHALALGGHSPLAGMFGEVCSTQMGGMYKADSIVYENSMGITGWVNEKKTLLGNRMIMESHSIPVPSMEVDRKILQSGKFPVYLAVDNKIAALFIVGYDADKGMLHRVRKLINTGVTILVRTVDPNVTADLICDKYGLPSDSVMIMESNASHIYSGYMQEVESSPATVTAPTADGFIDAYIESYAINRRNKVASIAIIVLSCIMMALTIIMPVFGMASTVNLLTTLISHTVTLIISMIIVAFLG